MAMVGNRMFRHILSIFSACMLLGAPSLSAAQAGAGSIDASAAPVRPPIIQATFACGRGKLIHATFDNRGRGSVALSLPDGRRVVLPQALSASGARYANQGETIVFWNKGNTVMLQQNGKTVYRCATSRRAPVVRSAG
jgi:membrane-bound inhibitor of C-type lysozyme